MWKSFKYLFTVTAWKMRGLDVGRLYKELMAREFWSIQEWRVYQNNLLREFIKHCYENVPFYRKRFDLLGLRPEDIQTVDDLVKIPVLAKDEIRANIDKILATNYPKSSLKEGNTTGSTGKPLKFYGNKERSEYIVAGMWRIYSRCGWRPGDRVASIWGFSSKHNTMPGWKRWLRDFFSSITHLNAWEANDEDFSRWYKLLKKRKPKVLVCYASSGSRFAQWLIDNNKKLESFKGVYCTSEKLYDNQQKLLERAFNCKVFDLYGCGEAIHIACSCEKGNMHINPDMVVMETGEENEVGAKPAIITGLRNWGMPFLRYMNGDSILLKEGVCECGRQSPMMELQISRLADIFKFGNGKSYPSLYFVLRLYKPGFDGVELFQFHQDKIDHIFLRVVKNSKFGDKTAENLELAATEIEEHIEHQAKVELVYVDYIEQSSSAKHYYAKSDVK